MRIVFFGTPKFVISVAEHLVNAGYEIAAVVTTPDIPVGRKRGLVATPVKLWAESRKIRVLQPNKLREPEFIDALRDLNAQLGIVASYGKIIPKEILELFPLGLLNIHPSLLPLYRGPAPVPYTLLNGDTRTGVTVIKIDEQMDHGPMLAQESLVIDLSDTTGTLLPKLFDLGAKLLIKNLPDYIDGKLELQPQDDSQATFSHLIKTSDAEISASDTVDLALRKVRAYNPEPGAYFYIDKGNKKIRIKIFEADQGNESDKSAIKLADGYLHLKLVQPEGKRPMSGDDFAHGYLVTVA